ncbi:hypothetical protein OROHE_011075 [Orobanche hederae]
MEECAAKDQSSASGRSTSRLLRYPLRSVTRPKEEKMPLSDSSNSNSATKRGRVPSSVSKSLSVLDLSGKEKTSKPPRRLSVPSKSNGTPAPKSVGTITPISETRAMRSAFSQGKSDTPVSDVSKSSTRKKFSTLSSASYWLSQIKLSESAAKHSVSLGFFKLALESGCEGSQNVQPIQRMSHELKSYIRRHDLPELGESVKELFEGYKISESYETSQVSGKCSQVASEGGGQFSDDNDDDVKSSSSSITDAEKVVKPKSLDINANDESGQVKNAVTEKDDSAKTTTKTSAPKRAASSTSASEVQVRSVQKKHQKPTKQEPAQDKKKVKKLGKKKSACEEGPLNSPPQEALEENKENTVASERAEVGSTEA